MKQNQHFKVAGMLFDLFYMIGYCYRFEVYETQRISGYHCCAFISVVLYTKMHMVIKLPTERLCIWQSLFQMIVQADRMTMFKSMINVILCMYIFCKVWQWTCGGFEFELRNSMLPQSNSAGERLIGIKPWTMLLAHIYARQIPLNL